MAASTQDILKPFDPTGYAAITGAQLAQLIDGAIPYTDKGMTVATADVAGVPVVPDANATTKWKNYIWIRTTATTIILYAWNPYITPDVTLLNWQTIIASTLPDNSVGTLQIQDGSITDAKIISLSYAKLTGAPGSLPPSGAAGGVLGGTYPNPTWAGADGIVAPSNLIIPAGSPGQNFRIKTDGTAPEFAQFGVLQRQYSQVSGLQQTAVLCTHGNMGVAEGAQLASIDFVPVSSNSKIKISLKGIMAISVNTDAVGQYAEFAVFQNALLRNYEYAFYNTVAGTAFPLSSGVIEYVMASWGAGVSKNCQARFGISGDAGGGTCRAYFSAANATGIFEIEEFFQG